ncbi:MAG: MFS transporter [Nocardioidaceae bacterium]
MGAGEDLRALLRGRRFRQLLAVRLTGQAFDGVFQVGLASYVLFTPQDKPTASAIAAGLAALLLPFSVLGPFVGVFLDRWRRRQVLVASNLVRVAPVLLIAVIVAGGSKGVGLFTVVLLTLSVNRFLLAGLSAALPHVVSRRSLTLANSVTPTSGTLAFMVGLGAASVARTLLPADDRDVLIVLASAVGYLVAGLLALRMPADLLGPDVDPARERVREALGTVVAGLAAGLRHLRARPTPAAALGVIAAHRFLYGVTTVATILLYRNYFHDASGTDAAVSGLASAVLVSGLGFFAAAVVTPLAAARMSLPRWMVVLLGLAAVVEIVPAALFTEWAILVAAFFLGVSAQGVKICVDTQVQAGVDDVFRGRVFALYDVIFNVVFVAAAGVGAFVIPPNGKSYALLVCVSFGYAATAVGYAVARRPLAR